MSDLQEASEVNDIKTQADAPVIPVVPVTAEVPPADEAAASSTPVVKPKKSVPKTVSADTPSDPPPVTPEVTASIPTPEHTEHINPNIITVTNPQYQEFLRKMLVQGKGKVFKHQGRNWTPIRDNHNWKFFADHQVPSAPDQYSKTSFI